MTYTPSEWDFTDQVVVITGGTGVLLRPTVITLAQRGAHVILLGRNLERAQTLLAPYGDQCAAYQADVTDPDTLQRTAEAVVERFGRVDALISGAGGNNPQATTSPELSFFDLPTDALRRTFELNALGALFSAQAFGRPMAQQQHGTIIHIASMAAIRPLTRIPAYSAAKAALTNFTQWLAVHMATEYAPTIRVNAIAPGFFLTEQNRFLLLDEQENLTPRGQAIIEHTPMRRFGTPHDLVGTVLWLLSPASAFVTGAVIPVDGGFSAFGGV